jgi:peptide/nickel transport system substrate-binding protein
MSYEKALVAVRSAAPAAFALALILVITGGCNGANDSFVFASPWVPASIDTTIEGYTFTRLGIAETLVGVDYDNKLVPMLAKSWSVSDDGLKWTFVLRDDVKFHDGTPLTADAAKASLQMTFKNATSYKTLPIKDITSKDRYTLEITTTKPFASLAGYLAGDSSAIVAQSSISGKGEFVKPVGTGPFKFDSWVPKEKVVALRFDDYWGNKSKLAKVTYLGVPDSKTRESMLRAGEADIAWLLSTAQVTEMKDDHDFKVYTQTRIGRVNQLWLNTNKTPLDDPRVRNAISIAIDRDLISKSLMDGLVPPAAGPFSPELYWADKDIKSINYDLDKAKSLLDEAGWTDSDKDGVREKGGKKLELALFTYNTRADLPPMAEAIKDMLGKAGIKVSITILDTTGISAQAKEGKVDMYLGSRSIFWNNDPDSWAADFLPGSSYQQYINYSPEDLVSLIEKGRTTMDNGERKKIYDQIQEKIMKDVPVAYITYFTNTAVVRSDVFGYIEHPTEFSYHLENVYKA